MSVQFAGGTIVNTVFTSNGTRSQMLSQLETALIAAGWTAISGGGSSDWIYETAVTPAGQKIRVEGIDPGGANNCIQLKLRSGAPNNLNPTLAQSWFIQGVNATTYRIWANKYSFFFFQSGTVMSSVRSFVCAGTLYLWPFLVPILNGSPWCGFMHGNASSDTGTGTLSTTWRNTAAGNNQPVGFTCIWNEFIQANTVNPIFFIGQGQSAAAAQSEWLYEDGSYYMMEPVITWPSGIGTAAPYTRHGQLYDCVLTSKLYNSEDIRTIGGYRWIALTHQMTSSSVRGGLLLYNP